ncbi:hypothetical protein BGZ60DRAFT_437694 [Tricladium varicosporioides]|nr:hypothetical protein BGZ60DRAFT_437694 [Hymenoscyphus varicosporioides]
MAESISIGAIASLGHLAWQVYKLCKDASESFKNVSTEVLSLHAVLREAEENFTRQSSTKPAGLITVVTGCRDVLTDLETLIVKYRGLGSKTQRVWDRMGWHSEDIAELRLRLISNTSLLSAFINSSQFAIEEKLDQLLKEIRHGHHEGSVISTQTVDSISVNEKEVWRAIRKELEDIGITTEAFDANKSFIMQWFQKALERGDFQEQNSDGESDKEFGSDGSGDLADINNPRIKGLGDSNVVAVKSTREGSPGRPQTSRPSNLRPKIPLRRSRFVLNLVRVLPIYNSDLCKACDAGDLEKVELLVSQGASVNSSAPTVWPQALLDLEDEHSYFKWKGSASSIELAMMGGYDSIVSFLIKQNAHCDGRLIALATKYGTLDTMKVILDSNPRFREYSELGTALEYAFKDGHHDRMQLLLPHVENFIVVGKNRNHGRWNLLNGNNTYRPLMWAASSLNLDLAKDLVSRGASMKSKSSALGYPNVNHLPYAFRRTEKEFLGEIPVLWMVAFQLPSNSDSRQDILALVKLLLNNRANPNQDNTMLQILAYGDIEVARLFIEFGGIVPEPSMIAHARKEYPRNIVTQNFLKSFSSV